MFLEEAAKKKAEKKLYLMKQNNEVSKQGLQKTKILENLKAIKLNPS